MILKNKVVVITGGAGLIGQAFVERVCVEGGTAIIADIDLNRAELVKNSIKNKDNNFSVDIVQLDICDKISIEKAIGHIHSLFGKIDALISNAYPRNNNYGRIFEDVEYSDFCENTSMHLGGYFLVAQQFSLFFKKQGFGNIINISSIYGVIAPRFEVYKGTSMTMPVEYAAVKSGLIHLTRYIAKYYKGDNIRCNTISIGGIEDGQEESFLEAYKAYSLNKGMLNPKDIVGTLVFLLSDMSMYMNGQNIIVDDGWTL